MEETHTVRDGRTGQEKLKMTRGLGERQRTLEQERRNGENMQRVEHLQVRISTPPRVNIEPKPWEEEVGVLLHVYYVLSVGLALRGIVCKILYPRGSFLIYSLREYSGITDFIIPFIASPGDQGCGLTCRVPTAPPKRL